MIASKTAADVVEGRIEGMMPETRSQATSCLPLSEPDLQVEL